MGGLFLVILRYQYVCYMNGRILKGGIKCATMFEWK